MEIARVSRTKRLLDGHLWVFSNELASSPKAFAPGEIVELRDRRDEFLGIGYANPASLIAVRILTREREEIDREFLKKRIVAALGYRKRHISGTTGFRAFYSESDGLPGLIVDRYDDCLAVQILTAGMERLTDTIVDVLDEVFSPATLVLRNDSPARQLEGLVREKKIVKGTLETLPVIDEHGVKLAVDPLGGQKTGLFLDQRENRTHFGRIAGEGEGLDLFCNTGGWGIHLAARGARVTCVDESEPALRQVHENAELNSLGHRVSTLRGEVFDFLKQESEGGKKYDFIVLDPPAFVKSRGKLSEALRGYRRLNGLAMGLLRKGGLLATSSCSYHLERHIFVEMLNVAARDAGRTARIVEMRSQGRDHPVLLAMPETEYLKCAFLEIL